MAEYEEVEGDAGECSHSKSNKVQIFFDEIVYSEAALEFTVRNEFLWKCRICGLLSCFEGQTEGWEIQKVRELTARGGPYYSAEITFLWQATQMDLDSFSIAVKIPKEKIAAWEKDRIPVEFEALFISRVEKIINQMALILMGSIKGLN